MDQPSPPRRVSSRVRTLDGYDAQGAVAEVVLDENCNFNVSGDDDDDDVLSTGVVATSSTSSTSPAKKQGSVYVGMKRFQSSPAALSSRVSSFFNPGIATNRTDSSNESCDSPSPSASEQSPSHSEPQRSPTCTPTSNADDNAVDDDGDFQEGECSEAEVRRNKESEKSSKCKSIFICATLLAVASGVGIAVSHSIHPFLPFAMSSNEPEPKEQLQQPEAMLPNDTSYTFDDGTTNREQPQPQQSDTVNEEQPPIPTAILIPTSSNETKITFYAMADAPYTDHERTVIMPQQIANLQNNSYTNFTSTDDAAFLVHLGDLQKAKIDECREHAYQNASAILKKSSLPVFVIPGDNDINDCEELEHGEAMWRQYFDKFDERWNHTFEVKRWGKIGQESFAFLHNRILFMGLNIVGGSPHSYTEWRARHAVHLNNTKAIMTAHKDDFSVVVFFGHAAPTEYHQDFFDGEDGFVKFVEKLGKPLLHLHGDDHEWAEYEAAWGLSNYLMVSLDAGEIAPPIKVEIDTSKENPIKIDRMEQDLEVECCRDGWPRLVDDVQNT